MEKIKLEHLSWKFIESCSKNKDEVYDESDIMNVCNVNIIDAIEISTFLVKMNVCKFESTIKTIG